MADRLGVEAIDREGRAVVLKFRPQAKMDPVRLVSLVRQRGDLTLVPPAALKLDAMGHRGHGAARQPRASADAAAAGGMPRRAAVVQSKPRRAGGPHGHGKRR